MTIKETDSRTQVEGVVSPTPTTTPASTPPPPKDAVARLLYEGLKDTPIPCQFNFASGEVLNLGPSDGPAFTVTFHSDKPLSRGLNEFAVSQAYIAGELDIEGDMPSFFGIRKYLKGSMSSGFMLKTWLRLFLRNAVRLNRESIAHHYNYGDDFYQTFTDTKYSLYSHCLFDDDDESLEEAAENKFATMVRALDLKAGQRLLDIGSGWAAVTRYGGPRDIHVTALTIAPDSEKLHNRLIEEQGWAHCQVRLEDFLEHAPTEPYDAIVIFGVIEHLPHYRQFVDQVFNCLKPGGRIYLDASASTEKYSVSNFVRQYIYPGTHSYLCLPDLVQEFLMRGFKVLETVDETHEYDLTLYHWARRFEENRAFYVEKWGEAVFRAFRLYLWGGSHAMRSRGLQAYHVVAERTENPGIQPGFFRRLRYFIRSLP